jgi:type IV pilus assembly protein PilC
MLLILGWLAPNSEAAFDPLGLGVGPPGAIRFLAIVGIFLAGIFGLYFLATRVLGQKATIHRILLKVPGIGGCLHALALTRFCLAMHLTMKTNISIGKALKKCLRATGNGAYEACADGVSGSLKRGKDVTETLEQCKVFPEDFLQVVATAEESGELSEVMGRQAEQYQEIASTRMSILTTLGNVGFLLFVLGLLAFIIIRMAMTYIGMIDKLAGP